MPADDALSEILARHLDVGRDCSASRPDGSESAIVADICDFALAFLSSVSSLVGLAETAILMRRPRLGPEGIGERPPSDTAPRLTHIPIQRP